MNSSSSAVCGSRIGFWVAGFPSSSLYGTAGGPRLCTAIRSQVRPIRHSYSDYGARRTNYAMFTHAIILSRPLMPLLCVVSCGSGKGQSYLLPHVGLRKIHPLLSIFGDFCSQRYKNSCKKNITETEHFCLFRYVIGELYSRKT